MLMLFTVATITVSIVDRFAQKWEEERRTLAGIDAAISSLSARRPWRASQPEQHSVVSQQRTIITVVEFKGRLMSPTEISVLGGPPAGSRCVQIELTPSEVLTLQRNAFDDPVVQALLNMRMRDTEERAA